MRTSARKFYGVTKKLTSAEPAATTEQSGAGEGHGAYMDGAAPMSIERYRSRVAAKVRTFEDDYWAMAEAWNRSRSVGPAEAAGRG